MTQAWLTGKAFSNCLPCSALEVRANKSKSSVGFAFPKGRGLKACSNPLQRVRPNQLTKATHLALIPNPSPRGEGQ